MSVFGKSIAPAITMTVVRLYIRNRQNYQSRFDIDAQDCLQDPVLIHVHSAHCIVPLLAANGRTKVPDYINQYGAEGRIGSKRETLTISIA